VINAPATMATLAILPRRPYCGTAASFSGIASPPKNQLKNSNQSVNVKNAVKQGYTRISGESSCSNFMRTKNHRTATVSRMPINPQTIQEGKNDPRILNEGAREHPTVNSIAANDTPIDVIRRMLGSLDVFNLPIMSRPLAME
jgi:hypothetical protein